MFGLRRRGWGGGGIGLLRQGTRIGRGVGRGVRRKRRRPHFGFGLEALEFFEGAVPGALQGIDDPLEALEGDGIGGEGVAGSAGYGGLDIFHQEGVADGLPKLGFDAARAAKAPFVVYEGVDEEALVGIGGAVVFVVFGGELGEIFGFFVEHDLVDGVDAVLEGVETRYGLARGSAGTGRFLRVGAAGCALFSGWHEPLLFEGSRGGGNISGRNFDKLFGMMGLAIF